MNSIVKTKLRESITKTINDRYAAKGVKLPAQKVERMVEAALVRQKYIAAGNQIKMFESAAVPANTAGRGGFSFGNNPTSASDSSRGSGERFDILFGLFLDAYASTVGFDILHTKQMTKSNIQVNVLEPIYAGGVINGNSAANNMVEVFTVALEFTGSPTALVVGNTYTIVDDTTPTPVALMTVKYAGRDRGNNTAAFRVVSIEAAQASNPLTTILDSAVNGAQIISGSGAFAFVPETVGYLNANTNHLKGFSAAGNNDDDNWSTNGHDGKAIHSGNSRPVGESRDFRTMGFNKWSRNFEAKTHKVKIAFTKEMYQDMMMEEDVDLHSMADVIGTEEISQSVNQEILSKTFAHGWTAHKQINEMTGFNGNLNFTASAGGNIQYVNKDGVMTGITGAPASLTTSLQNSINTLQRAVVSRIGFMGGVIGNRSRMGKGDTVVAGTNLSSAISDIRGFRENPFENTLVENEDVSFVGTFKKMSLYEDTTMSISDRRVSVSKKGNDKTSGLTLCNYILADKTATVAEGTGEEVSFLYSRLNVVEKGSNPSLNYITFDVAGAEIV
jgi:hypothetical protein